MFRGGTCLNKLHMTVPTCYSEDLDYVRRSAGDIGDLTRAASAIGERLGMDVRTQITQQPKVYLRAPFEFGAATMRIKVEVNTSERSPARELVRLPFSVGSAWFTSSADVQTFARAELAATKLRALSQRSKGRDLFDLWLAVTQLDVAPAELVDCFEPYRPGGCTRGRAEQNRRAKLADANFRGDLNQLVSTWPDGYDIDVAAEVIIADVLLLL